MKDRKFIDSNIILYLYSDDEQDKKNIIEELYLFLEDTIISKQVINEIANILQI